jgi:hypothetical protein
MKLTLLISCVLAVCLGTTDPAAGAVEIIGSWTSGTSHAEEAGSDRALVFTAHAESSADTSDLGSVTYGGQSMTKVVERNMHVSYSEYTCAFILDEAGIAAASGSDFVVTWNTAPSGTPAFTSVFLQNVNQSTLVGATGTGGTTTTTAETPPLSNSDGDMAIVAGTCGNAAEYSTINGFTEAIEVAPSSADGIGGYLACTGSDVTPGVSHTNVNRQSVIGFVVQVAGPAGATVQFASASSGDVEAVTPALVEVILIDALAGETYTVDYDVIGGTAQGGGVDYTLAAGTLTFLPDSVSEFISIDIVDDGQDEDDETIVIELSSPTGPDIQLGDPNQHTYTIVDPRPTAEFDEADSSGMESVTPVYVSVSLSAPATETITVDYDVIGGTATGGGVDYTLDPGTLTFNIDDVTKDIVIDIVSDGNDQEPAETIIIELSNPAGTKLGAQSQHTYTILSQVLHLKVDFAQVYCPDSNIIRTETAKPGWWLWATGRWADMYAHDCAWACEQFPCPGGIDGTGITAAVTLILEGDLGMKVSGLTGGLGGGVCPTGSPIYEPICNSWLQCIDWPEFEWGSIQLVLHDVPPGEYELYSYHNHFGCYREPQGEYTPVPCDCICDPAPPMPVIRAMSCKESRELPYQSSDAWTKLFPGIDWTNGPWPEGVVDIQDACNVQPQQVTTDAELVPSLIKFSTDGSPVLIFYKSGCCEPDPVRPSRVGGRAILNAFELVQVVAVPDTDPPTPNPATFASPPAAVSDTEITMTATTGSDASPPVEYYFDETSGNPGGTDSGWVTNPVYNDTGLDPETQYTYTVQMRDSLANTGTASAPANATTDPAPDTDPPTPNPATFASPPAAVSHNEITMTATTGSDASPPVEYYFDETSGNPGGTDSGWVTNPVYNDTGLQADTTYTYTVQMRDSVPNTGTASAPANATTDPAPPDTDPPTPDPATFASPPAAVSDSEITMTATTGTDASPPVEYYFDETSGNPGGTDSGWVTNPVYNDTGLTASTQYTYTVQMRDSLANTGTASAPANATTDPAPDTDPPTPNPATFASAPAAVSDTEITMTATTGSDASPPVEYYFDETSGNPGGSDSGWITNTTYNDTGLDPETQYTYTVQMRDSLANTGTASAPASATTDPKSGCGAAPMYRDSAIANVSAAGSCTNALLPLIPSMLCLGFWSIRRRKRS